MVLRFCFFILLMSLHGAILAQGALEPPAPPGPTMKTLDQVEPRIPISEAVVINEAGSYYLTNPISGTFNIQADNVTLDLNGFTITPESVLAIRVFIGADNLRIFNGAIAGGEGGGIAGSGMGSVSISDLQFFDITGACIELSNPSGILMIERIRCHQATRAGIMIRQFQDQPLHVVIRDNVISNVATTTAVSTYGIGVFHNAIGDWNVVVTGNKMMNNRFWGLGMRGDDATVSGQVTDNLASGNGGPGIQVLADVVVAKNIAAGNGSNYNVTSQRAAPITALDQNPGPWDNISE